MAAVNWPKPPITLSTAISPNENKRPSFDDPSPSDSTSAVTRYLERFVNDRNSVVDCAWRCVA